MSILDRIRAQGGDVIREEWRLHLRRGRMSDAAVAWVSAHTHDLAQEVWPEFDEWVERASIKEFCAGKDRATAEREAYLEVMGKC